MAFRLVRLHSVSSLLLFHICLVVSTLAMSTPAPQSPMQSLTSTAHFHIQFDGCFRPPRDSGFPTIPHCMAVCAACIGKVDACNDGNISSNSNENENHGMTVTPLAVGAMELPVFIETTSQHAEYEGLLMGLEWLIEFISVQNRNAKHKLEEDLTGDKDWERDKLYLQQRGQKARVMLTIEGDCKTVIDQLTGKSIPRKLESLHLRAETLLDELSSMHAITTITDGEIKSSTNDQFEVEYRHIPRSQNSISDSLCNNFMNIISLKSWMGSIRLLEEVENQIMEQRISSSLTPSLSLSLSEIFEKSIRTTKFSLRSHLYEIVAKLAVKTENYKLLVEIGERLIEEESSLKGRDRGVDDSNSSRVAATKSSGKTIGSLKRTGVNYQIRGWEGLGKEKKIRFLQRKYCILLSNDDECDSDEGKYDEFISFIDDEKYDRRKVHLSKSTESINIINQNLKNLCDVTEGEWNALIPDVWKLMLDKWFVSARNEQVEEAVGDKLLPVWIEDT